MASLQKERFGHFHVTFRFAGKRYKRTLDTKSEVAANARKETIKETLTLIGKGRLQIPQGIDPATFILADGKLTEAEEATPSEKPVNGKQTPPPRLDCLFKQFFDSIPDGNLEQSTLDGMHIHKNHFLRILKPDFLIDTLSLQHLQSYVNKRAKEHTHFYADTESIENGHARTKVNASTIHKELVTVRRQL